MSCLSLPQKKLLKVLLNVINDKLDKDLNQQNTPTLPQQTQQSNPNHQLLSA